MVQLNASYIGKRLTPQGYRLPSVVANLGYRYRVHGGLTTVLSLSDIFDSQRDRSSIDSATIVEASARRNTQRVATLSLSMPLRGNSRSGGDTGFEFEQ